MSPESETQFDPEEMSKYGFDPAREGDCDVWLETTPGDTPNDIVRKYADDPFEFNSSSSNPQPQQ